MKTKQLIEILKKKENEELEFIICNKNGELVTMSIDRPAHKMSELLSLFGGKEAPKEHNRDTKRMIKWFLDQEWEEHFDNGEDIYDLIISHPLQPSDDGVVIDYDYVDFDIVYNTWFNQNCEDK